MSKTMFLDTETNGLPEVKSWGVYYEPMFLSYYDNSRMIELAYIIYNDDKTIFKSVNYIIRPDGFVINNSQFHGITTDDAKQFGVDIQDVFEEFESDLKDINVIVGHNINFDLHIILSECYRSNNIDIVSKIKKITKICTMEKGKMYMSVRKFPKLTELYQYLFNKPIDQQHRALSDTRICADCYYKMNP
jgi:DNA polymerase III epsilon subunit-like protein